MFRKMVSLVLAMLMVCSLAMAVAEEAHEPVTISYYSTQAGVDDETVAILKQFMEEYPWITVNYYPCGDDQLAAWLGLYAAGTAPTVSLLDVGQILNYSDYMYDFNTGDTSWQDNILSGLEYCQKEGSDALYGIPSSYQGFGLIYNKRVVADVFGEGYDVSQVNTVDKLDAFLAEIEKAGVPGTIIFSADWALGAHYLGCQLFSEWQGDKQTQRAMLQSLRDGNYSLMENETYNNLMDVFDMLKKYNLNKADPLADTQENDCYALARGEAATMFQGDWNWLVFGAMDPAERDELAIMPLPLNNDENDARNGKLLGSCPKGYCVDIYQNTPQQQEAGALLAKWLTFSEPNQRFMVEMVGSTLPFANAYSSDDNPLAVSTREYLNAEKMLDISTYICEGPSDFWLQVGPYMQAYLAGQMDRAQVAAEIESYFYNLE